MPIIFDGLFDEWVELIKGRLFKMPPAPNPAHQKIAGNIYGTLWTFLKGRSCDVLIAPFDVRFPKGSAEAKAIYTVVQPDVCVVCDEEKLGFAGCNGTPDLIVEILSPSSSSRDLQVKYEIYEEHGVQEYRVVYPGENVLEIFLLDNGCY